MGIIKEFQSDLDNAAVRVVGEYRARLHAEAVKLCGDASEADDLVMRTFDAAFRDTSSYDATKGELYPWLVGVLRRIYAKTDRRLVNRGTIPVDPAVLQDLAGISEDTVDEILERSDHDALREAMNRLDPEYKKMLVMHYFGELPVKQIATVMNMPVGTVLWRLNIARKILARDLGEKLGRKPVAVLLAALLGIGTLFGAWVSPLGDWVAEKVFGSAPAVEAVSAQGVEDFSDNKQNETPQVGDQQQVADPQEKEGDETMNIKSAFTNTLAVAAVAAAGLAASAETEDEPQLVAVTLKNDDPGNTSSLVGLGNCAGWSDGSVAAIDPNKEYVVNGCNLRTPLSDSVGVYTDDVLTFGGGLLTFQGTGTRFSGAGSKLTLKCLDKTFVVPRLRVASGELLMEHGQLTSALANSIVVSGTDWQVMPGATIWFSSFWFSDGYDSDKQSRRLVVKAPISGTGTLRCAGEGLSAGRTDMPGEIVFADAGNAFFTGRFTTQAHANPSEPVVISFLTSRSWFGNPSEYCADGVVISDNAAIDFECSLQQTGENRGFTFMGSGSVISVAEGNTVTIDGRIVAPHGFVKKGRGELIIASTGSSVGGTINVQEGVLRVVSDDALVPFLHCGEQGTVLTPEDIFVYAVGYLGLVDGEAHSPSLTILTPMDGEGCTVNWSADGGRTWSSRAPSYSTPVDKVLRYRVTCEGRPPCEGDVRMWLAQGGNRRFVSHFGLDLPPYDTPEKAASSLEKAVGCAAAGEVICIASSSDPYAVSTSGIGKRGVSYEGPTDRSAKLVISGAGVITLANEADDAVSFSGFTLTNGGGAKGALDIDSSANNDGLTVSNCLFNGIVNAVQFNAASDNEVLIANCEFANVTNELDTSGGIVLINKRTSVRMVRTTIRDCSFSAAAKAGTDFSLAPIFIGASGSTVTAADCSFRNINVTGKYYSSGVISVRAGIGQDLFNVTSTFDRCTFQNCSGRHGFCRLAGNNIDDYGNALTLRNCLLEKVCSVVPTTPAATSAMNTAQFFFFVNGLTLENCTLVDCRAAGNVVLPGGGVSVVNLRNTIIKDMLNVAGTAAVPLCVADYRPAASAIVNTLVSTAKPAGEQTPATWYPDGDGNYTDAARGVVGKLLFKGDEPNPLALADGSFGRGLGDASIWASTDVDLVGNPRLSTKGTVDLGCYEYRPKRGLVIFLGMISR